MKKHWSLILLVFITGFIFGQNIPYWMNTQQGTYEELIDPVSINEGEVWTPYCSYPVYFNFNFDILWQTYTSLNVRAGGLEFSGYGTKHLQVIMTPFGGYFLRDRGETLSASPLGYEVTGESGEQVLKIQYKNAGFEPWAGFDTIDDFINYQVWLFEADNRIEIHFGPQSSGYGVSFNDFIDPKFFCDDPFALTIFGNADNPSWAWIDYTNPIYYFLDGLPSEGIIYTIYPNPNFTDIHILPDGPELRVFPNPFHDHLFIRGSIGQERLFDLNITDLSGHVCYQETFQSQTDPVEHSINVSALERGVYLLVIRDQHGWPLFRQLICRQ
jgi:hypothetical protein